MTAPIQTHTIEQTGQRYLLVAGFPDRAQLAEALRDPVLTVYCLFPYGYRAEQTQVQLRNSIHAELDRLGQPRRRCMALVLNDPALGEQLDAFDFDTACRQALAQVTPKQPHTGGAVPIPAFGPAPTDTHD